MKYFKYVVVLLLGLVFINEVKASTIDYSKINFTSDLAYFNCTSAYTCTPISTPATNNTSSNGSYSISTWSSNVNLTSLAYKYGLGLSFFVEEGFIKDSIYTVSILLDNRYATYNVLSPNSKVSGTLNDNISFIDNQGVNIDFKVMVLDDYNFSLITYTFKANQTGNYLFLTFGSSIDLTTVWHFYGYTYTSHGTQVPSSQDIVNSLQGSFNDLQNSINTGLNNVETSINATINNSTSSIINIATSSLNAVNDLSSVLDNKFNDLNNNLFDIENSINSSINMVETSINSTINNMNDKIDDSINSDDSDVNSGKCGILCKLKGIFSGILNLPQNIWNFLKQGFDAITDGISSMFEGIKNIFSPEKTCTTSENLFNNTKTPHSQSSSIVNVEVTDNGFKMSNTLSGSWSHTLGPYKIYIIDSVKNLDGKTLTVSSDTTGHYSIGYYYYSNSWNALARLDNHTLTVDSNVSNGAGNVVIFFTVPNGSTVEYKNIMVNEGSTPKDYTPYGHEECTGGESFLSWLGNFFKNLISGILELPGKLVNLLVTALKELFIPTDDQLYNIINKAQDLTENFGFVGESMNFFINIFTSLLGLVNQNGCINLPEFSIGSTSLFESHKFWDAQNVCLADNSILSANIEMIRTITSIALVCLFINFASSKFSSILSKNDNAVTSGMAAQTRGEIV